MATAFGLDVRLSVGPLCCAMLRGRAALVVVSALGFLAAAPSVVAQTRPNVVLIYADDLGYGDVSAYGATKLKTPNIDRLAREGVRFTDAHATAATCTPSRYAMLTGEYAWRKPGTDILPATRR